MSRLPYHPHSFKFIKLKQILTVCLLAVCTATASAGGFAGGGKDFGSGWESDGRGGYRGTGNNFGKGWESDGRGGFRGTGDNFGRRWEKR
jgi:hypothetical protein